MKEEEKDNKYDAFHLVMHLVSLANGEGGDLSNFLFTTRSKMQGNCLTIITFALWHSVRIEYRRASGYVSVYGSVLCVWFLSAHLKWQSF